jgi:sporulation protein YlmC with PRC-barrel domain
MAKAKSDEKAMMVKLSDTTLVVTDPAQDIRGRTVVDTKREEIGKVDDLYIDQGEEKVRFLEVSAGGFLGLGDTKFLIPVDAITGISEDEVRIDKTREHVAGAPRYSPELVDTRLLTNMYDYYGSKPYWGRAYVYPPYPYYPPMP